MFVPGCAIERPPALLAHQCLPRPRVAGKQLGILARLPHLQNPASSVRCHEMIVGRRLRESYKGEG